MSKSLIIMVDGGFCSQLVKYTLGEFLKKETNLPVKYDITWFKNNGMDCDGKEKREFLIKKIFPNIDFEIATEEEIKQAKSNCLFKNSNPFKFCRALLGLSAPAYIDGYYENIIYMDKVRKVLKRNLNFSHLNLDENNLRYLKEIKNSEYSCAVHVRRGDYVKLGAAILTPKYYVSAIKNIEKYYAKRVHFFFFSNDLEWIKLNIIPLCPPSLLYSLVDANTNDTGYYDLYLISQCNAQISSNSSFGFWGGYLNENINKVCVVPSKWTPRIGKIEYYAFCGHYLKNSIVVDINGGNSFLGNVARLQQKLDLLTEQRIFLQLYLKFKIKLCLTVNTLYKVCSEFF